MLNAPKLQSSQVTLGLYGRTVSESNVLPGEAPVDFCLCAGFNTQAYPPAKAASIIDHSCIKIPLIELRATLRRSAALRPLGGRNGRVAPLTPAQHLERHRPPDLVAVQNADEVVSAADRNTIERKDDVSDYDTS